jgi:hypothetical protein
MPALTITRTEIDRAVAVLDEGISAAVKGDVSIHSLLPSNSYSRDLASRMNGKKSLTQLATRLYGTSPRRWVEKIKESFGR